MFRETDIDTQMSLFDNPADLMGKRAAKKYEDPKAWFNQFFGLVTSQIDESVFKPLFKEGNMGAPTASIRRLVAMSILKEGFGCSDEDLMEKCDYDLLTRKALGLVKMEDEAPFLITGVQVEGATAADNAFYEDAIAKSETTTGTKVETVYSDGAYQNADNRALSVCGVFTGIQGRQSSYLLDESDGDTVRITDTRTGEVYEAKRTRGGALRIPYPGDRSRYK